MIGDVEGKIAVIIDDIIDTAGTLVAGAQALKEAGATKVYACATHGLFNGPALERIADERDRQARRHRHRSARPARAARQRPGALGRGDPRRDDLERLRRRLGLGDLRRREPALLASAASRRRRGWPRGLRAWSDEVRRHPLRVPPARPWYRQQRVGSMTPLGWQGACRATGEPGRRPGRRGVRTCPPLRGARSPAGPAAEVAAIDRSPAEPTSGHALQFAAVSGDRIKLEVKERGADQLGSRNASACVARGSSPACSTGRRAGVRRRRARASHRADRPVRAARDRRRRHRGPEDGAPRGAQGVPAASDPRHDHARRSPRGPARPADPGDGRRAARRRVRRRQDGWRPLAGRARAAASRRCRGTFPEHIEVDITRLELGDVLRLADIPAIDGRDVPRRSARDGHRHCSVPARAHRGRGGRRDEAAEAPRPSAECSQPAGRRHAGEPDEE